MSTLSIDSQRVRDIAAFINNEANNYDTHITELYNKFNGLANLWSGADYDAAKVIMDQNRQALLDLGTTLHEMANALNSTADDYENKINASAAQFRV